MRTYIVSLLIIFLFSCGKVNGDLSGNGELKGQLFIENPYTGESAKELSNHQVFIRNNTADTSAYLYSTKSDNNGYFTFTQLNDKDYYLYAKHTRPTAWDSQVVFRYEKLVNGNGQGIRSVLTPDEITQNGIFITCKDRLGGSLPNDSVFIYTSRILAVNDTGRLQGAGATYKLITNTTGIILKVNVPYQDSLYINAFGKFDSLKLKSLLNVVKLNVYGFVLKSLELK